MASLRHGLLCVLVLVLCQSSIEAKKRAAPKRRQLIAETGKSDEKIWETGLGKLGLRSREICMLKLGTN
jgi:hypothetical protein